MGCNLISDRENLSRFSTRKFMTNMAIFRYKYFPFTGTLQSSENEIFRISVSDALWRVIGGKSTARRLINSRVGFTNECSHTTLSCFSRECETTCDDDATNCFRSRGIKIIGRDRRARSTEMRRRMDSRGSFRNDTLADNHSRLCGVAWKYTFCRTQDADGYLSLSEISDLNRRVPFIRLCNDDTISALQPDGWFDMSVNIVEAKVNKQTIYESAYKANTHGICVCGIVLHSSLQMLRRYYSSLCQWVENYAVTNVY